ncbi:MAG: hypothetical protein CL920_35925 [Deltaproteobacteria bacterium]|nr:hypothetical protein [Deltaproteobacteria bacterium]MBU54116.1 hypothetical protein [Deltaproteobacteria bacterium]|tara:strand:- start:5208 stop:7385 length:2178 start_codon:yes stop_codon:yes gene_type:complete
MSSIHGPKGPIYYIRDDFGYPRIYARDEDDGTFARGYLHAKDRMIQVYLTLMLARGRVMEITGDVPFARMMDRAVRSLDLQRHLSSQLDTMTPYTRDFLQTYCDGFNAYTKKSRRPYLLKLIGLPSTPLEPKDIMLIYRFVAYFGLSSMQHLAEAITAEFVKLRVPSHIMEVLIGESARDIHYNALAQMATFPEDVFLAPPHVGGSNAFAVDSQRSATDGALLMGEFHMEIGKFPPVLYAFHIDYPDNYYQGIGIPGLAWLSAGRNREVGWSYTFGHADNIDILIERCKDEQYLVGDTWKPLTRRVETAHMKNTQPVEWIFYDNEYGTVLGDASKTGDYPCVRWSGIHGGASDIEAAHRMANTRNIDEFAALQREIRVLSLEGVFADCHGRIGSIHSGQVDLRPKDWTGPFPYPGWQWTERTFETLPESARPHNIDPTSGVVVSANAHITGKDEETWTSLPEASYRLRRLTQLLEDLDQVGHHDMVAASYDEVDLCAQELLAIWEPLLPDDPRCKALCAWAATQTPYADDKAHASISLFHALHQEVLRAFFLPYFGQKRIERFLNDFSLTLYFQHHIDPVLKLEKPDILDQKTLKELLHMAWPRALKLTQSEDWALPVHAPFKNVLTDGQLPSFLGVSQPPVRLPGGPVCAFQSRRIKLYGEPLYFGPAFHYLMDMSEQGGWYNIAGGASELPWGPGYGKGIKAWLEGDFIPLGDPTSAPPSHKK